MFDFINIYLFDFVKVEIGLGVCQMVIGYIVIEMIIKDVLVMVMLNVVNKEVVKFFYVLIS